MEEVIQFKSIDGEFFPTKEACLFRDTLIEKYNELEKRLTPKDSRTSNGGGFVQQNKCVIKKVMLEVIRSIDGISHLRTPSLMNNPFESRYGIIGRIISDEDHPANNLWFRFMCMDDQYREFDQPYFASHSWKAKDICFATPNTDKG